MISIVKHISSWFPNGVNWEVLTLQIRTTLPSFLCFQSSRINPGDDIEFQFDLDESLREITEATLNTILDNHIPDQYLMKPIDSSKYNLSVSGDPSFISKLDKYQNMKIFKIPGKSLSGYPTDISVVISLDDLCTAGYIRLLDITNGNILIESSIGVYTSPTRISLGECIHANWPVDSADVSIQISRSSTNVNSSITFYSLDINY